MWLHYVSEYASLGVPDYFSQEAGICQEQQLSEQTFLIRFEQKLKILLQ